MKTAIQQLIEELKANMAGVGVSSNESSVSKMEQQWYQASYSTMSKILLDLEVNFLEIEKKQIIEAVDETMNEMELYDSFRTLKNGEQYYKETFGDNAR